VYCHYHYSTRFATKCAGCSSAILKQFVEINRNNRDECWHPECYMINKVRVYSFLFLLLSGTCKDSEICRMVVFGGWDTLASNLLSSVRAAPETFTFFTTAY
jgi:hypothetical protein